MKGLLFKDNHVLMADALCIVKRSCNAEQRGLAPSARRSILMAANILAASVLRIFI